MTQEELEELVVALKRLYEEDKKQTRNVTLTEHPSKNHADSAIIR